MALSAASRFDLLGNRRFHSELTHFRVSLPGKRSKCTTWSRLIKCQVLRIVTYCDYRPLSLCPNDQAARFYTASILIAVEALWDRNATWWGLVAFNLVNRWMGEGKFDLWWVDLQKHISLFLRLLNEYLQDSVTHLGTLKMDRIAFELSNLSREEGVPTTGSLSHQCDNELLILLDRSLMSVIAKDGLGLYDFPKIADFLRCSYSWFCVQTTKFPDVCFKSWPGHIWNSGRSMRIIQIRQFFETFPHVWPHLNSNKVVYRDLKPENVMLDQEAVKSIHLVGSFMALPSYLLNHNVYFTVYIHVHNTLYHPHDWSKVGLFGSFKWYQSRTCQCFNTCQHISIKSEEFVSPSGLCEDHWLRGWVSWTTSATGIADDLSLPVFHRHTSI